MRWFLQSTLLLRLQWEEEAAVVQLESLGKEKEVGLLF